MTAPRAITARRREHPALEAPAQLRFRVHGIDHSGWSIRFGPSEFLVAYGAGWSAPIGRDLLRTLRARPTIYPVRRPRRARP